MQKALRNHTKSKSELGYTLLMVFLALVAITVVIAISLMISMAYLRGHLSKISDNSNLPWTTTFQNVVPNHKHVDIIFYRDNCPHCKKVIPKTYFENVLANHNIQYRDVNRGNNMDICNTLNGGEYPSSVMVHTKNHRLMTKRMPLNQITKSDIWEFSIIVLVIIVIAVAVSFAIN